MRHEGVYELVWYRSHDVAKLLGDWLQDVIQAVKPWISSAGIDRGELWFRKISDNLGEVNMGIVCLTPENKEAPWILFEAGALLKGIPEARVMTFLIDLKPQDIRDPLAQFNHTTPSKTDMFALVTTLNSKLGDAALTEARLASVFNTFWPQFETKFDAIMAAYKPEIKVVERPQSEILTEVLDSVRGIQKQLRVLPLSSLPMMAGRGRGLAAETLLARTAKEVVEEFVSHAIRSGQSLPEILASAEAGALPNHPVMIDHAIQFYNSMADDPRFMSVDKPMRFYGGGDPVDIPLGHGPANDPKGA